MDMISNLDFSGGRRKVVFCDKVSGKTMSIFGKKKMKTFNFCNPSRMLSFLSVVRGPADCLTQNYIIAQRQDEAHLLRVRFH